MKYSHVGFEHLGPVSFWRWWMGPSLFCLWLSFVLKRWASVFLWFVGSKQSATLKSLSTPFDNGHTRHFHPPTLAFRPSSHSVYSVLVLIQVSSIISGVSGGNIIKGNRYLERWTGFCCPSPEHTQTVVLVLVGGWRRPTLLICGRCCIYHSSSVMRRNPPSPVPRLLLAALSGLPRWKASLMHRKSW